jgi:hypothetical protein
MLSPTSVPACMKGGRGAAVIVGTGVYQVYQPAVLYPMIVHDSTWQRLVWLYKLAAIRTQREPDCMLRTLFERTCASSGSSVASCNTLYTVKQ